MNLLKLLYSSRFWPNIYVSQSPFKIFEYNTMLQGLRFTGDELVLDLGCGGGLQTCSLAKQAAKVVGIDICDLSMAEKKRARCQGKLNIELLNSRLQDASLENDTFDKVFSFCVIEHIPEYEEILRKSLSLLKPGGELVISVDSLHGVPADLKLAHTKEHAVVHYFRKMSYSSCSKKLDSKKLKSNQYFGVGLHAYYFKKE